MHINVLELHAVHHAFSCFADIFQNHSILVQMDNTVTMFYGIYWCTRSRLLCQEALEVQVEVVELQASILALNISGVFSKEADILSRMLPCTHKWYIRDTCLEPVLFQGRERLGFDQGCVPQPVARGPVLCSFPISCIYQSHREGQERGHKHDIGSPFLPSPELVLSPRGHGIGSVSPISKCPRSSERWRSITLQCQLPKLDCVEAPD